MTRIQTETRSLPTELSPEDLAEESKRLATAVEEVAKQKDAIAEKTGLWRETKKKMEGYLAHLEDDMNTLATIVDSGFADREVECSWLYALKVGYAFLIRDDTKELVHHRKLGDQERQENLLEVLREPTEEQLAAWTVELGLVLDPQQDLELAAPIDAEWVEEDEPVFYYRDFTLSTEEGDEWITARFTEADHRPASLAGVHSHGEPLTGTGLPEQINRGALVFDDRQPILQRYRQALEDLLEARRTEALRSRAEPGEDAPSGRGRKGK